MDSEEEKTGEIYGASQSSSLIQGIVEQAAIDKQEENRGEIQQRVTHDEEEEEYRSQPDPIPLDLTLEILSRLPAKSIMRFLCVSKLWSSYTTLPSFISSFASRPWRLVLTFLKYKKRFVFSFPQHENTDESYSTVYNYEMKTQTLGGVTAVIIRLNPSRALMYIVYLIFLVIYLEMLVTVVMFVW